MDDWGGGFIALAGRPANGRATATREPPFLILSGNPPRSLPGVYAIINRKTGEHYVGMAKNIRERAYSHAYGNGSTYKLQAAISASANGTFAFVPLYYAFDYDRGHIREVEGCLMLAFDAVDRGYNAQAPRRAK